MSLESSPGPAKGAPNSSLRDDSTAAQNDVIGPLGDALAGVTLGPSSGNNNAFGFHDERGEPSGNPFNSSNPSTGNNNAWGGFSNPDTSRNSFARSGSSGTEQGGKNSTSEQQTPDHVERKQSIELFLSRNPSEVLGSDIFKEVSTGNLPGLAINENPENNFRGAGGQPTGNRRGSPSSNVTGTTASNTTGSRSNSPYGSGNTIKAYPGYDQNKNDISATTNAPVYQPMTPGPTANVTNSMSPRPQTSYNNAGLNQHYNSPAQDRNVHNSGTPTNNSLPPHQPQQQVLYMAVPTPDGRQVLQPVQMVQMPGKPYAFVLPGSEGMQGGMQSGGQPMMVMPTMMPQQGQLNSPIGRQQHGMHGHQSNDSMNGLVGMNNNGGRNSHHNKNIGGAYHGSSNDVGGSGFNNNISGNLRSDDYGSIQGQGNIDGGDPQYLNQPNDPTLASLYSTPQRPPLDALLGQVRRLSRDQVGCRLVQQALDEEGPMAATLILNEGLPFWGEAMVDPFGNYLFQKILEKITAEERIMLVKTVSTRLVNASLNLHGTRSVQKIVELCTKDEENAKSSSDKDGAANEETAADVLTKALTPAAARLCIDSHGNHVIQRILLKLGHKHSKFVFDAVAESVGDVARHRHGCCVIQRCLDSPPGPARSNLVCRIVDKSLELMQDAYGNYVVQYVLDVCSDDDVHAVCESVVGKVNLLAIQKFSSNVMEKCLERCSDRVKEHYMQELSDPERIRELMMDPFGNYVVQRALSVATHTQAVRLVEAMRPHLIAQSPGTPNGQRNGGVRNTAGGRRIMAKICRRFPNFNLNASGTREELYSQNRSRHHHNNHHHQSTAVVPPMYGAMPQLSSPQLQVLQQPQHQQQQQQPLYTPTPNLTDYNTTPLAINPLNMGGLQFDQRQPYYDPSADAGYFQHQQHQQHNNHFGQGAYPSGL